jgi:hypothetical protein
VRRPTRCVGAVLGLALVLATTACTDEQKPDAAPSPSPSTTSAAPAPRSAPFTVRVTRVHGNLAKKDRPALEANVGSVVRRYVDAAFLAGDYPRGDFANAFSTFTSGAARKARRDRGLLTNARFGPTTESVRALRRAAYLSVLAPYDVAAGVTAKVDLLFLVDRGDRPAERVRLTGRLMLGRDKTNGWKIFGYDLARSDVPVRRAG